MHMYRRIAPSCGEFASLFTELCDMQGACVDVVWTSLRLHICFMPPIRCRLPSEERSGDTCRVCVNNTRPAGGSLFGWWPTHKVIWFIVFYIYQVTMWHIVQTGIAYTVWIALERGDCDCWSRQLSRSCIWEQRHAESATGSPTHASSIRGGPRPVTLEKDKLCNGLYIQLYI